MRVALTLRLGLRSPSPFHARSRSPTVSFSSHRTVSFSSPRLSSVLGSSASDDLIIHLEQEQIPQPQAQLQLGGPDGPSDGSGNGRGGAGGDGEEEEEEEMGMLMSQKFTLAYAALVGVGGLMGFLKKGSIKSASAGAASSLLLFYVHSQLPSNPTFASSLGLGISGALLAVMGSRFKKSAKIFPAGVVSLVSLFMSAGYLHAILRR